MGETTAIALRPSTALLGQAVGAALPQYVTREQARAIINAAETTTHRLLLECLWQSGGRVSEVLRLRPCDVDRTEAALVLVNLKQRRRALRQKRVYVSPDLVAALGALAKDARVPSNGYYFRSRESGDRPMSRYQCWRLIRRYAERAGVLFVGPDGLEHSPTGLMFRHGAAVHLLRYGIPLPEVGRHLGHARADTTLIYTRLTDAERRNYADRVTW